jgi:microcystin-dependent protein
MEIDILIAISLIILVIVVVVIVIVIRKKDNYEYPPGSKQIYPTSSINIPAKDITQPVFSKSMVSDGNGNISVSSAVPIGGIIMWAGSISTIPTGWGICDGSSYVNIDTKADIISPDLRSKFVVGVGNNSANMTSPYMNTYKVGDVGGEEYHQLTTPEMPSHNHTTQYGNNGDGNGTISFGAANPITTYDTSGTGGDPNNNSITLPHNNMPPYYALAYIIKYL